MLAGGLDALYRAALAAPHEPIIQVDIWRSGVRIVEDMEIASGEVTATLASRVSRVASVVADGAYFDLVSPFSDVLRAYRGLRFGDGSEYVWQVFGGRITDTGLNPQGQLDFNAEDMAGTVVSRGFTVPEQSTTGAIVSDEVVRVISDAVPDALFGTFDPYAVRVPLLTWEHDRASALDEMATAVGSFWYPLANERFVLRRVPWTVDKPSILTLRDGEGGIVLGSSVRRDRRNVFNQVTVTGERLDGSDPVYYTASDTDPTSPTYIGGPFGIQNKLLSLNTPANQDVARGAAFDYLRRSTALTDAWTVECPPDAAIELGDVFDLDVQGRNVFRQVVASIQMPLVVEGSMTLDMRAQVIGGLTDSA